MNLRRTNRMARSGPMAFAVLCGAFALTGAMSAEGAGRSDAVPTSGVKPKVERRPAPADGATGKAAADGLLPGGRSREPINISSDRLVFLKDENKLIYIGNVVAVQGESTLKASKLDIDIQKDSAKGITAPIAPPTVEGSGSVVGHSSVRHMEADGPVTLTSKDQIGTGDHASYDKAANSVTMRGHVTLSQGDSVVQGDELTYDLLTGRADVIGGVKSVLTPRGGPPVDPSQKRR